MSDFGQHLLSGNVLWYNLIEVFFFFIFFRRRSFRTHVYSPLTTSYVPSFLLALPVLTRCH